MKMTSYDAYMLLLKDIVNSEDDLDKDENRWIKHCIYVGRAAERIANQLGLDGDYAKALGYLHDIGRKINHPNHAIEGYNFLMKLKHPLEAKICMTHSFVENDIDAIAEKPLKDSPAFPFVNSFLQEHPCTLYDNIIQLCDLFCLSKGFTTVERRMYDIVSRKGVHENSVYHWEKVKALKEKIESLMGCELYSLFPEVKNDLITVYEDRNKLENLLNSEVVKTI